MKNWLLVGVSVLLAGCGSTRAQAPAFKVLQRDEIAWVRRYADWNRWVFTNVRQAERIHAAVLAGRSSRQAYAGAVARVEHCDARYAKDVGLPPSRRLTFAVRLILGACRGFADAEKLQLEALGHDPGEKLFEAQGAVNKSQQLFIVANDRLERQLLWNEPLPTIGGASGRSRIEPRFSRVASTVADRSVQARCWSRSDWPRVLGEFHAWSPRPADLSGFAIPDLGRINLEPWSCEHLDGLTYRHEFPTGSGQLDMAWAVGLLSHETQHLVAGGTEAETECYGDQSLERVARALGAPSTYARALAVRYWRDAYPTLPANYRTNRCRNGGPLDAHANSSRWP